MIDRIIVISIYNRQSTDGCSDRRESNNMDINQVRTRTAVTRFGKDGIMRSSMLPGAEETLADAQENVREAVRLASGRQVPLLVEMRGMKSQEREARDYYNTPEVVQAHSAIALVVGSRVSSLIANFFISITARNSTRPVRMFTDEAEAEAWLKGFLE
jgi:hypothetical protein